MTFPNHRAVHVAIELQLAQMWYSAPDVAWHLIGLAPLVPASPPMPSHLKLVCSNPSIHRPSHRSSESELDILLTSGGGEPGVYVQGGQRRSFLAALNLLRHLGRHTWIDSCTSLQPTSRGARLVWSTAQGMIVACDFSLATLDLWRLQLTPSAHRVRADARPALFAVECRKHHVMFIT